MSETTPEASPDIAKSMRQSLQQDRPQERRQNARHDAKRPLIAAPKRGIFARLMRSRRLSDTAPRQSCCIVAVLMILDRSLALDGLIMSVNRGGMLFRQASVFVFDRQGAEVLLRYADVDCRGRISEVTRDGYWIRFAAPLSQDEVDALVKMYGAQPEQPNP